MRQCDLFSVNSAVKIHSRFQTVFAIRRENRFVENVRPKPGIRKLVIFVLIFAARQLCYKRVGRVIFTGAVQRNLSTIGK